MRQVSFLWMQMVPAVLPMVKLVEAAEGVLESSDRHETHQDHHFLFKNMFQSIIFGKG